MIERQNDALAKETMEWDDIIHEEQAKRTELPEGDYSFTVKRLEKGRFEGSDKLPACNIAFISGEEMQQKLSGYLAVLAEQNPAAVGGQLPADDFYYLAGSAVEEAAQTEAE